MRGVLGLVECVDCGGGGGNDGVGGRRLRVARGRVRWLYRMDADGEEACLLLGMWGSGGGEGGCRGGGRRRRRRRRPRGYTFVGLGGRAGVGERDG